METAVSNEPLGAAKDLNLGELEDWIADNESIIGPLTNINCAPGGTVANFDIDGEPVTKRARVILDPEGAAQCPAPSQKVCRGRAYVSGTCVEVLICR